jgi:DNA-binding LacI/PurR family transcriptional regulator
MDHEASAERPVKPAAPSRPNLAAVAALAGVSPSTASLAFSGTGPVSEKTRARVMAAAEQLNYAGPDPRGQSLRRGRSGIVGVVIEDRLRDAFRDPMNVAMLDGIADATGSVGSGLLLLTDTGEGSGSIESAPVDAVVLIGCSTRLDGSVAIFRQRGIPLVAIEAEHMDGVVAIDLDNHAATRVLAEHLRELGHERIGLVALPLDPSGVRAPLTAEWESRSTAFSASERILGLREIYPELVGWVAVGSLPEEGRLAALELLSLEPRPTAIVAQSDLLALGVILAADELGLRIPEDLSVVGFDGVRLDGIAPRDLTTMVQPAVEKGLAAGRAVVALLAEEPAEGVAFTSTFHRGNTTGPAPAPSRTTR